MRHVIFVILESIGSLFRIDYGIRGLFSLRLHCGILILILLFCSIVSHVICL